MPLDGEARPHATDTAQAVSEPVAGRCTARRRDGQPCTQWRVQGATVCRMHGGSAPRVRAAGRRRVAEQQARRAVSLLDPAVPVTDALSALAQLAGEVTRWKDLAAERVAALEQFRYTADGAGTEQLRAEVDVYRQAMSECRQVLAIIARLDIDNRLAKISEQQAHVMMRVVEVALTAAGTAGAAAERGRAAAAGELRAAS